MVEMVEEVLAAFGHRTAGDDTDATGDHPGRHALGVRVDRMEHPVGAQMSTALSLSASGRDRLFGSLPDDALLLGDERHPGRAAGPTVPADDVHRQLDRLPNGRRETGWCNVQLQPPFSIVIPGVRGHAHRVDSPQTASQRKHDRQRP
ncbi:hypothetical protein ACNAW0_04430 [Micromonospora sp. SL1-18]|uniref:hypothetical protein n=1 Tax=Micromonospora sp. SL1-18 TaxID=3399128 RepID=UPI003A4DA558